MTSDERWVILRVKIGSLRVNGHRFWEPSKRYDKAISKTLAASQASKLKAEMLRDASIELHASMLGMRPVIEDNDRVHNETQFAKRMAELIRYNALLDTIIVKRGLHNLER